MTCLATSCVDSVRSKCRKRRRDDANIRLVRFDKADALLEHKTARTAEEWRSLMSVWKMESRRCFLSIYYMFLGIVGS